MLKCANKQKKKKIHILLKSFKQIVHGYSNQNA